MENFRQFLCIPVALMSVFGLGMCFSVLGSISVKLMPRLNIDKGKFGSLISMFMFSCVIASLIIGVVIDKIGYRPVAIFGFVAVAVCIFLIGRGKTYSAVVWPCLLLGIAAMAVNIAGNTLIPQVLFGGENESAALNMGNIFFGLGLFLTPLVVSFLFRKISYEGAITVLAVIVLLPVVLAIFATYPASAAGFELKSAFALPFKEPAVLVAALALFCYIALESSFCNWLTPYGKEMISAASPDADTGAVDASAQRMLSVFAVAMMVGRLITSLTPALKTHGMWFIAGATLVAGVIILIMTVSKKVGIVWVLAALSGLAFAPIFPTILGVTYSKFTSDVYGSVFGIAFAVGLLGAVIAPKAIGNWAKGSSVQKSLKLLLPFCIILIVLAFILGYVKGPVS